MIKFGTGGWRAVIGDEFVRENIQKVGQGVADLAKAQGKLTQERRLFAHAARHPQNVFFNVDRREVFCQPAEHFLIE